MCPTVGLQGVRGRECGGTRLLLGLRSAPAPAHGLANASTSVGARQRAGDRLRADARHRPRLGQLPSGVPWRQRRHGRVLPPTTANPADRFRRSVQGRLGALGHQHRRFAWSDSRSADGSWRRCRMQEARRRHAVGHPKRQGNDVPCVSCSEPSDALVLIVDLRLAVMRLTAAPSAHCATMPAPATSFVAKYAARRIGTGPDALLLLRRLLIKALASDSGRMARKKPRLSPDRFGARNPMT